MRLCTTGHNRYKYARLERRSDWVVVAAGRSGRVRYEDVPAIEGHGPAPAKLSVRVGEALEHLRLVATEPDEESAALRLLEHTQEYGLLDLCQHGGAPYHPRWKGPIPHFKLGAVRASTACRPLTSDGRGLLALTDVTDFVNALDAASRIHERVRAGQEISDGIFEDLARWGVFPPGSSDASLTTEETETDDESVPRLVMTDFFRQARAMSGVEVVPVWPKRKNPTDVLFSPTLLGLYLSQAYDELAGTGMNVVRCHICSEVIPGRRAGTSSRRAYCDRLSCRRARDTLHAAESRARRRTEEKRHV